MLAGLWGDGWFYISAGGFFVSSALFVFLLGQYRAAVEAEDQEFSDSEPVRAVIPSRESPSAEKVYVPKAVAETRTEAVVPIVPVVKPQPQPAEVVSADSSSAARSAPPQPKPLEAQAASAPASAQAPARRSESSTGGISPAVVYLQNLKTQMERFDKEMTQLKAITSQQAAQGELILKRLTELSEQMRSGLAAPKDKPSEEAAAAFKPEEVAEALKIELNPSPRTLLSSPSPQAQPAAESAAGKPEEKPVAEEDGPKPRKGPVWPI